MERTRLYYRALGYSPDYRWSHNETAPFTRLKRPLDQAKIEAAKRKAQERDEFTGKVGSMEYIEQQRAAVEEWERQREARMGVEERELRRKPSAERQVARRMSLGPAGMADSVLQYFFPLGGGDRGEEKLLALQGMRIKPTVHAKLLSRNALAVDPPK